VRRDFLYLESDGQVYLLKDGKRWRFPRPAEAPCRFIPVFIMPIHGQNVLFAKPVLKHHPAHWFHKDHVIGRTEIDPLVQQAINRSLPRGAAKVAIIEKGNVLMVRAARGLTKGMWNLPGGFMGYGEHPEESARREVEEELGIRVRLTRLLGVYAETFERTGGYMLSFVYLGTRRPGPLRPHPEEIESTRWMPIRQAMRESRNPFAQQGLRDYLRKRKGEGTR
jgi:ADP-ribose pyrophosphatase YjhB (NUDIX family)